MAGGTAWAIAPGAALVPQEGKEALHPTPVGHDGGMGLTPAWKAAVSRHPYPWAWSGQSLIQGGMPGRGSSTAKQVRATEHIILRRRRIVAGAQMREIRRDHAWL